MVLVQFGDGDLDLGDADDILGRERLELDLLSAGCQCQLEYELRSYSHALGRILGHILLVVWVVVHLDVHFVPPLWY
jgi:hypothetical protein